MSDLSLRGYFKCCSKSTKRLKVVWNTLLYKEKQNKNKQKQKQKQEQNKTKTNKQTKHRKSVLGFKERIIQKNQRIQI